MALHHLQDVKVQGGLGFHSRHAQAAELQGLCFSRSQKGGCRCPQPQRRMSYSDFPQSIHALTFCLQNLRSVEEMEEEEHQAQSAKLQELIRRGTPHDLQEANKLMKIMAGYDNRHKTDYRAKAAEEVGKIQQKARLLEEMLQGYKQGDEIKEGDVFEVSCIICLIELTTHPSIHTVLSIHTDPPYRNSPTLLQALNQRFRECAKRNPRTTRPSPNFSR